MADSDLHSLAIGLARMHLVISRGVETARTAAHEYATGAAPDASASAGLADYLQALASVLHAHHGAEETVAFPALRVRFPNTPWDLLLEEHQAVVALLGDLERHLTTIREQPSADRWAPAAQALDQLATLWGPHFQREEAHFTREAVDAIVLEDEQAALVQQMAMHGQEHAKPDYLVVPFLLFNLDGDERRAMSAQLPPLVTEQLVPVVWQERWAAMKPYLLA